MLSSLESYACANSSDGGDIFVQQDPQPWTSADATHAPVPPRYKAYEPILSSYPLLSGHSLASQQSPQASSTRSWLRVPDLKPLKLRTALRSIAAAGSQGQRVCQYEVPGGGECRDVKCGDLHIGRIAVEPSGAPCPHCV